MNNMKKSILFVDDEPNILAGFKRMFRFLWHEVNFHFVESGEEALAFIAAKHVDVIVSDMRMPGMDGATLLLIVQERYPHIVRFMLCGHSNRELIMRTRGVVHQLLTKPISQKALKEALARGCAFQDLMQNVHVKSMISRVGNLPKIPAAYTELQRKLQDPECPLTEIADIISRDLAMSAKVLQLVNSSFFGFRQKIDSLARAVNLLGFDVVKTLALVVGAFSELKPVANTSVPIQTLLGHSLCVAGFAKTIVEAETDAKDEADNAFTAGFVHDVGKLLFLSSVPQEYEKVIRLAREQELECFQAEKQVLNADHAATGGYLVGTWGLPGPVVEAVAFHHKLNHYPEPSFCTAVAVHVADVLYHQLNPHPQCIPPPLNLDYLVRAGLADRFDHWRALCQEMKNRRSI